jgi:hypothetical protein
VKAEGFKLGHYPFGHFRDTIIPKWNNALPRIHWTFLRAALSFAP